MRRRQFLKVGVLSAAALAAIAWLHEPLDRAGKAALRQRFPMSAAMREVLPAIVPVVLAGALPSERAAHQTAIYRAVDGVAEAVSALSAEAQKEVAELFALLHFAPARIALAGVSRPWPDATAEDIRRFLDNWRDSRLDLLKTAYLALHDLILGAWYADPLTWDAIGYPGPPAVRWDTRQ